MFVNLVFLVNLHQFDLLIDCLMFPVSAYDVKRIRAEGANGMICVGRLIVSTLPFTELDGVGSKLMVSPQV